jgi:hypothetical protein
MINMLHTCAASYNQAKTDGKVDLFIELACQALWKEKPLDIPAELATDVEYNEIITKQWAKVCTAFKYHQLYLTSGSVSLSWKKWTASSPLVSSTLNHFGRQ